MPLPPTGFQALALPHLQRRFRLAVRLTGTANDAEDLVHETYMKGFRAVDTPRDPERIGPWLARILARLVLDRQRRPEWEVPVGDLPELDRFSLYDLILEEDPFPFLERFESDEVRGALLALPEVYRVPLVLLHTEDLSYAELAEALGCPAGTVMSRLHRGRKLLERALWDYARRRGLIQTWPR